MPASIHAVVIGRNGAPAGNLSAADFELSVGGRPVSIEAISPSPPVAAIILFDVTNTIVGQGHAWAYTWERPEFFQSLARAFESRLRATDRVRMGAVGRRLMLVREFSSDRAVLMAAASAALDMPKDERLGPSPIWDAIHLAARSLAGEPGWRNIILVTDGLASGNLASSEDAAEQAVAAGVTVHVVEAGLITQPAFAGVSPGHRRMIESATAIARRVADATGGSYVTRHYPPASATPEPEIGQCIQRILEGLHAGYAVHFRPPPLTPGRHSVELRAVARDDVTVRAPAMIVANVRAD